MSQFQVIGAVSFYIVTSITMVLANKWVLGTLPDLPIFFLWLQLVVAVLLLLLTNQFTSLMKLPTIGTIISIPEISMRKSWDLMPLIAINVFGLAGNTLTLKYIDASLYQVARSLVLPFTLLLQYTMLKQPSSVGTLGACAVVCAGFVAGLFGDGLDSKISPSIVGIAYGIFSSFATALRAIYIKTSMEVVKGNTIELVWYNNVLSAVFMVPVVLAAGETNQAIELFTGDDASEEGRVSTFMLGLLVTGLFGFLINLAGFLQIKVTSPVSHMISGAFRGVLQTLLAVWAFGDILTTARAAGILLILLGSTWYTWVKTKETKDKKANRDDDEEELVAMERASETTVLTSPVTSPKLNRD